MTPFDKFKEMLAEHGLELRTQWQRVEANAMWSHFLIYGKTDRKHHDIVVCLWPDEGYQIYFPGGNSIPADIAEILGETK
jgi:hypothetical protein